jgi:hypothetical protein
MRIGDRVRAQKHIGTIVEPTEEMLALRPRIVNPKAHTWVKFDGPGPYGDGVGVYSLLPYELYRLPSAQQKPPVA